MSDNSINRQEKALRLLQGMSGIDGELLERSEKTVTASGRVLRFARRYGAFCAACLVCAVLCSAYFLNDGWQSKDAGNSEATPMNLTAEVRNDAREEAVCDEEETLLQKAAAEYLVADTAAAVDWRIPADGSRMDYGTGITPEENANKAADGKEANKQDTIEPETQMSGAALSLQAPAGYSGNSEQELQEDGTGVYTWYQEDIPCYVRVILLDSAAIDSLCENGDVLVRDSKGRWLTMLPAADETGLRQFAVSVGGGVVAEYYGYLTEEQIQQLFE